MSKLTPEDIQGKSLNLIFHTNGTLLIVEDRSDRLLKSYTHAEVLEILLEHELGPDVKLRAKLV